MSAAPQPILTRMPWNVKQKIIDFSVVHMKSTIRQLNTEFKALVDTSPITYQSLSLELTKSSSADFVKISLARNEDDLHVEFHNIPGGYRVVKANSEEKNVIREGELPFISRAALHLANVLANPKLRFEELIVKLNSPSRRSYHPFTVRQFAVRKCALLRMLSATLAQLNHKLNVETLQFFFDGQQEDILAVLPHLKPGILGRILLEDMNYPQNGYSFSLAPISLDIDRIVATDQWREANCLMAERYQLSGLISACQHFDTLSIYIESLTLAEFDDLLQAQIRNTSFENAHISCFALDIDEFNNYLEQYPEDNQLGAPDGRKIPIPNTFLYLNVKILRFRVAPNNIFSPHLSKISICKRTDFCRVQEDGLN